MKIDELRDKANRLPLLPGVYIMKDARGEVIYVGKAKALKNRVTSYFRGEHLPKVAAMVSHVDNFDVIVVKTEFEALVLENSLIKRYKPRYNILLKDDKGYPFIRLDAKSEYPRFSLANHTAKDSAQYFGPFGGRSQTKDIIDTVCKALHLPTLFASLSPRHRQGAAVPQLPHGLLRGLVPLKRAGGRGVPFSHSPGRARALGPHKGAYGRAHQADGSLRLRI